MKGLILLTFLATLSVSSFAALETEPNDETGDADSLYIGQTLVGSLSSYEDIDIYRFVLSSPADLTLSIRKVERDYDYIQYIVFDANQVVEDAALASGTVYNDEAVTKRIGVETGGTYFLAILGRNSYDTSDGEYEITITSSPLSGFVETEPNNAPVTADELQFDRSMVGHIEGVESLDFFYVDIAGPSTVTLDIEKQQRDYDYIRYGLCSIEISSEQIEVCYAAGEVYNDESDRKRIGFTEAGRYFVFVGPRNSYDTSFDEYSILLSQTSLVGNVETEPNNVEAQADELSNGISKTGHLAGYQDIDIYSLEVNSPSQLTLNIEKLERDYNYIIYAVTDAGGALLASGTLYNDELDAKRIGLDGTGTYYIGIGGRDSYNTSLNEYEITAFVTEDPNNSNEDSDGDSVLDDVDNCPSVQNENQLDTDGDNLGDVCDQDDDGDGIADTDDAFPLDASEYLDTDADGVGNNADTDDDGDGVEDASDDFPLDATETLDTDGDGVGNNADTDDDDDGYSDAEEIQAGTDPLSTDSYPSEAYEDIGGLPIWLYYIATQPQAAIEPSP